MLDLGKRIHPTLPATADLTDDPVGGVFSSVGRAKIQHGSGLDRLRSWRHGQIHTEQSWEGRLIRHAGLQAAAVSALAVTMIETPFGALLVTPVGLAALQAAGFFTATGTAITLAPITVAAEIKHRAAGSKVTHALTKDCGTRRRHRVCAGGLDNRRRSWKDDSCWVGGPRF
jgi:uncharacterized membrane protein (DUF2068 family)